MTPDVHPAALRAAYNFYRFSPRDEVRQERHPAAHNLAAVIHAEYAFVPGLIEAIQAALLLADEEGSLPDNGEYHGGAIADQLRCALAAAENAEAQP